MSFRQIFPMCLAVVALAGSARSAVAQDALIEPTQLIEASSVVAARPAAAIAADSTDAIEPRKEVSPAKRPSWVVPMHVLTATVQGIDAHSTLDVLAHRGAESPSLYHRMTANKMAFVAVKAGIAATVIYATDKLSKRHRVGAVLTAAAVNSVYLVVAAQNYRSVRARESRLGR